MRHILQHKHTKHFCKEKGWGEWPPFHSTWITPVNELYVTTEKVVLMVATAKSNLTFHLRMYMLASFPALHSYILFCGFFFVCPIMILMPLCSRIQPIMLTQSTHYAQEVTFYAPFKYFMTSYRNYDGCLAWPIKYFIVSCIHPIEVPNTQLCPTLIASYTLLINIPRHTYYKVWQSQWQYS